MKRIFVSYSRKDENFARKLATALSTAGYDLWIDVDDIPAGMNWNPAIQTGLQRMQVLIVVVSPDSMVSPKVLDEMDYAWTHGKRIIPLLYRPADMRYPLKQMQYIDFHNDTFERAMQRLIDEIEKPTPHEAAARRAEIEGWGLALGLLLWRGCGWLVIIVIGFVILAVIYSRLQPFQESTGHRFEIEAVTLPQVDEITAYKGYSRSDESLLVEAPALTLRRLWNDELWVQVQSTVGQPQDFAYVPAADIPGDQSLLYVLPLTVNNVGTPLVTYSRPDAEEAPITRLGESPVAELLGFWIGEDGSAWYFIDHVTAHTTWIVAQDQSYLPYLSGYVTPSAAIEAYPESAQVGTAWDIASGTHLFITELSGGYYKALVFIEGEWQVIYIEQSALTLPDPMQTRLSERAA
jgi:hypothetical protein